MDHGDRFAAEVERLAAGRTLTEVDRSAVEAVAGLTMRVAEARRVLDAEGITVEVRGELKEHPAVGVEKKCSQEIRGGLSSARICLGSRRCRLRRVGSLSRGSCSRPGGRWSVWRFLGCRSLDCRPSLMGMPPVVMLRWRSPGFVG